MAARTGSSSMSCAESAPEMVVPVRPCGRRVDLDGADQLAVFVFEVEDADVRAERGEDVEQRGAGGVEAELVEDEVGAGEERGGAEEEGGGGDVTGDGGFDGVELLAAGDGDGIAGAVDGRAEGAEGELAVVAGADGFANGGGAAWPGVRRRAERF